MIAVKVRKSASYREETALSNVRIAEPIHGEMILNLLATPLITAAFCGIDERWIHVVKFSATPGAWVFADLPH